MNKMNALCNVDNVVEQSLNQNNVNVTLQYIDYSILLV